MNDALSMCFKWRVGESLGRSELPLSPPLSEDLKMGQGGDVVKFSDDGQMPGCPGGRRLFVTGLCFVHL